MLHYQHHKSDFNLSVNHSGETQRDKTVKRLYKTDTAGQSNEAKSRVIVPAELCLYLLVFSVSCCASGNLPAQNVG